MEEKTIGVYEAPKYKEMLRNNLMQAQRVNNSGADVTGLEATITTLTDIIGGVVETKYYKLNGQKLSDFCKIEVGRGAYATELMQYASTFVGNNGKQGIVNPTANGISKDANSSIQIGSIKMPNNFWRWDYTVTNELVNMAQKNAETFSIIEENEKARKKIWDLMLQDAWFNGLGDGRSYGLLNQPNVTVNTTLMTAELGDMTDAQFQTFLAKVAGEYNKVSNYAISFNRMLIPSEQYFALTQPYGTFGLNRLQVLEDAMKRIVGADFKIVHAKYCTGASAQGGNKGRYVFYNDDADNVCAYLPVPYTPMPLFPQGSLDLISQAHGQFVCPFLKRETSMMYADCQ